MELSLKLLSGRSAGQELKVTVRKFLIGRADDCHLRPHSDLVSRHHCVLMVEEGFCAIRDFGSRNGTFVNDEKIVGQQELKNGDRIKVGVVELEVQLSSHVGGKKRPKVKDIKDAAQRTAAGANSGGEEADISDWLSVDGDEVRETRRVDAATPKDQPLHETPAAGHSLRETQFVKSATEETTTLNPVPKPTSESTKDPAADAARGAEAAKQLFGGKKVVAAGKNNPKDSREAAADALKRIFNTRRP